MNRSLLRPISWKTSNGSPINWAENVAENKTQFQFDSPDLFGLELESRPPFLLLIGSEDHLFIGVRMRFVFVHVVLPANGRIELARSTSIPRLLSHSTPQGGATRQHRFANMVRVRKIEYCIVQHDH
jgi:hypothetical protein